MAKSGAAMTQAKNEVEQKGRQAAGSSGVATIARVGYAVRGVLYAVVGLLAVQVALGAGGATTDKNGAIEAIGAQPFGKLLLVVVVIGLAGYALWGVIRAVFDPLNRGSDAKGIAQRIGYAISALSYGGLIIPTVALILGTGSGSSGGGAPSWTAKLLAAPFGPWLVGLVGLIGMAGGLGQMFQGVMAKFKDDFKQQEMSHDELEWATAIGRIGLAARGIVFLMLGFFLVQAALHVDPQQAKGLDGALQTLAHQPHGPWVLGVVAVGLVAFGVYSMICARWIRIGSR